MKRFLITLTNEIEKMAKRRKWVAGMIVAMLIPLIPVVGDWLSSGVFTNLLWREDLYRISLSLFTPLLLPLFVIAMTADAFAAGKQGDSLRTSLLMPESRIGQFVAKTLSVVTGSAAILAAMGLSSIVFGLLLPTRGTMLTALVTGLMQLIVSLLPVIMLTAFAALAAQFLKSGSSVVLMLIAASLLLRMLPIWIDNISRVLPTSYVGYGAGYIGLSSLIFATVVMLGWTVMAGGIAMMRFEKRMI